MKFLFEWLKDFMEIEGSPEDAAGELTRLGLETEVLRHKGRPVLEVEIPSNRPDCLSVKGIARELSASRGLQSRDAGFNLREAGRPAPESARVEILSALCPRYCAKIVTGLKCGPSPGWLAGRIEASGIRPVNNIVDATNYSLMVTGHPLHAFDLRKLSGGMVIARQASDGEKLVTLDGVERKLDPSMLVIADAEKPVALAGIMGGLETEVGDDTSEILLEGAYFSPAAVRRACKALKMDTEASYRFQRGADIENIIFSLRYASSLLAEVAGGVPAPGEIDRGVTEAVPAEVDFRLARAERILGAGMDEDFLRRKLGLLGFGVSGKSSGVFHVRAPSFRQDVSREIDLVEEAARLIGYENIPETMPSGEIPEFEVPGELVFQAEIRKILTAAGLSEAVNNGLIRSSSAEKFGQCFELPDPLSEEQNALRPSLLPGLLENIRTNLNAGALGVKLFELGKIFPGGGEKISLAGAMSGANPCHWLRDPGPFGFFDAKGIVEALFEGINAGGHGCREGGGGVFDPAESAAVTAGGAECGAVGRLLSGISGMQGIDQPVFAFELDFGVLFKAVDFEKKFRPVPRFPAGCRDAAFIVSEEVKSADIEAIIRRAGGELLEGFELFDVYRGKQIPPGKKSVAFSFRYRAEDRTLEDAEISEAHQGIVSAVAERLGASLRKD